ncbi:MAG: TraB/GumN family protein, partial [Rhizobiaceae bacterium]
DQVDDVMETMLTLYTQGEIALIMPVLKQIQPEGAEAQEAGYGEFEEIMINARNGVMAERARDRLAKGSVFIAVGALHLPGEKGLVELLRKDGYTVTAAAK